MSQQNNIQFLIELLAKNKGALEAAAALGKVGAQAKQTKTEMAGLTKQSGALGDQLSRFFAAGAVLAFARSALTEFAKVERGFGAIGIQMRQLGIDADKALPRVEAGLQAISDAGDGLLTETVPAFQRFLGLTKDADAAMSLVTLASRMAESGMGDLSQAVLTLTQLVSGQAARGLKQFGINISGAEDGSVDAAEALKLLNASFTEETAAIQDTQDELDKLEASWSKMKQVAGPAVKFIIDLFLDLVKNVSAVGAAIFTVFDRTAYGGGLQKFLLKLGENVDATWAGLGMSAEPGKAGLQSGEEYQKGFLTALIKAQEAIDAKNKAKREKEAEDARKAAAERAEIEADADEKLLQQKAAMAAKGTEVALQADLRLLETQRLRAIEAAQKAGADTEAIHETFMLARAQKIADFGAFQESQDADLREREMDAAVRRTEIDDEILENAMERYRQEMEAERELLQLQLESDELTLESRKDLEKKLARLDLQRKLSTVTSEKAKAAIIAAAGLQEGQLATTLADQKKALNRQAVMQAVAIGEAVFGESKALAIAQAVINTWNAANAALASPPGPPWTIPLTALVVATGLANVAKIMATEKESGGKRGFDDPMNDRLAYLGGRKWADDMVRLTNTGFRDALASQPLVQPLAAGGEGASQISLTVNGLYGGRAGMRHLRRELERATRLDRPRRTR